MEPELLSNLRTLAEAYGAAVNMKLATVAQRALGDWQFFDRLDKGPPEPGKKQPSFTVRKYDEAVSWFSASWPAGVAWPQGITRPDLTASDAAA